MDTQRGMGGYGMTGNIERRAKAGRLNLLSQTPLDDFVEVAG